MSWWFIGCCCLDCPDDCTSCGNYSISLSKSPDSGCCKTLVDHFNAQSPTATRTGCEWYYNDFITEDEGGFDCFKTLSFSLTCLNGVWTASLQICWSADVGGTCSGCEEFIADTATQDDPGTGCPPLSWTFSSVSPCTSITATLS